MKQKKIKYFICSDIHGFYDEWVDALDKSGFNIKNKDHHIILCGDLLDRGRQPKECLLFVNKLLKQNRIICIMGNHELLLNNAISKEYLDDDIDIHNGTTSTVYDLVGINEHGEDKNGVYISDYDALKTLSEYSPWTNYYNSCKFYYETPNYIFVHSWIPQAKNWRDVNNEVNLNEWIEHGVWDNPFVKWELNGKSGIDGKTIVFGHWNTSWAYVQYRGYDKQFLGDFETMYCDENNILHPTVCHDIFKDNGIIGIDGCTVKSKKVNVLVLNGDEM